LKCGPWRKAAKMVHRSLVTPERVLSENNEDSIFLKFFLILYVVNLHFDLLGNYYRKNLTSYNNRTFIG